MRKFFALTAVCALAACSNTAAVQTAIVGAPDAFNCELAIQAKLATEPTATTAQKILDGAAVAQITPACVALKTDATTLVGQVLNGAQ